MKKRSFLQWILPILIWCWGLGVGAIGNALGLVCVAVLIFNIYRHFQSKAHSITGNTDMAAYAAACDTLSEKELVKATIALELDRGTIGEAKLVSKTGLKRRCIYTAIYIPLNYLFVCGFYHQNVGMFLCSLLTLVYAWLTFSANTVSVLYKKAKASPNTPIAQLIREDTFNDVETPKCRKLLIAGLVVMAASLALFVGTHLESYFEFTDTENGVAVAAYYPAVYENDVQVSIPETVDGKPVTGITSGAFAGNNRLVAVQIPNGIAYIEGEAFKNCEKLRHITIPEGVTAIRGNTFEGCTALERVTLHEGIEAIHAYAFKDCRSLKDITLPSRITEIRAYTFENCRSLEKMEIPMGVTRIAAHAFYGCSALSEVTVPDTVMEIGSSAFRGCDALEQIVLPPDTVVNEKAFKESPTNVRRKYFVDSVWQEILQELDTKEVDTVHYVYNLEKGPDEIYYPAEEGVVVIADSALFMELVGESMALQPVMNDKQLLAYLQKAKEAGAAMVEYRYYSQIGSEVKGKTWFATADWQIDEMIAICEESIAEADHA